MYVVEEVVEVVRTYRVFYVCIAHCWWRDVSAIGNPIYVIRS